ncbi:MAG TPA: AAA family ATPase [Kofleriaceae bacterium]
MHSGAVLDPRFELVDELGRGGMGIVYRARDRERGGEVALKALREVKPIELLRLKREFRVMCNVLHPNLVRLGELMERDGGWFFTMELVDGVDFLEWVGAVPDSSPNESSRRVTTPNAASKRARDDEVTRTMNEPTAAAQRIVPPPPDLRPPPRYHDVRLRTALRGVANGLAGLHRAGLVHRDIKPSNIKIDGNGRVVLLDFGVAIALDDADSEVAGTYAYMAPEQAAGNTTAASDWYAVGVMLFRALTGHLPFPPTRAGLELKASMPTPSPALFVSDLPEDLVALCRALLEADPAARAGEAAVKAALGVVLPLRAPTPTLAPFIGRRTERARLLEAFDRQRRKLSCETVLIIGASGVGKTALARRFLDEHVASQAMILESRCDERETVPFNAIDGIIDGLARLIARHPERLPEAALDVLRSPDAAQLRRLFPVLPEKGSARRQNLSLEDSRAAAARALRALLVAIGEAGPLAIMIDDAQWADADSGALFADLFAISPPPLFLIVTARGPERPALVADMLITEISLGGLDVNDGILLAMAIAANKPIDAAAIAREADGHPMFIAELSRFTAERSASAGGLDDALWARACDLPPGARQLLHAVVTDGGALSLPIAVAAAQLADEEAGDAIATLRAARLVRATDNIVEPYHDRVREAVLARLPRAERVALHFVLGRALQDSGAPPERLAHHWAGAGELERAAACAEAAAERATNALAFERAAEWLEMVLSLGRHDETKRRALLVARAEMLSQAGDPHGAGQAFLEASTTGELDAIEQRDLRRRAAESLLVGGYSIEGLEVLRALLAEVGLPWPATRGAALRNVTWYYVRLGTTRLRWRPRTEAALDPKQKLRIDTCWSAAVGLSMLDSIRGSAFAFRALDQALAAGEPRRIANALAGAAFAAAGMNQHRRLRRLTKAIARAADQTDAPEAHCYVALAEAARAYFVDNDWPATGDIARRGRAVWTDAGRGHTAEAALFEQFIGWSHATAGDYRAAADHAERVLRDARRRGDRFLEVGFRTQFPHRYVLEDHADEGVRDLEDALRSWPVPAELEPISNQFYWAWRSRTMLALYAGRAEADAAMLEQGLRRIERGLLWKVPAVRLDVSIWSGAWSAARAAEAKRSGAKAREHIAEARRCLKIIAASPLPARLPSVHSFAAVIAHLEGHDDRAIAALRKAIAQLDRFKMTGPAVAARWRLGMLVGGDEGAALIDGARAWLDDAKASQPARMVAFGMPGIE